MSDLYIQVSSDGKVVVVVVMEEHCPKRFLSHNHEKQFDGQLHLLLTLSLGVLADCAHALTPSGNS